MSIHVIRMVFRRPKVNARAAWDVRSLWVRGVATFIGVWAFIAAYRLGRVAPDITDGILYKNSTTDFVLIYPQLFIMGSSDSRVRSTGSR